MKSDYQEKLTIDDTQKIFNNYFKNDIGYKNLLYLASRCYLNRQQSLSPHIKFNSLKEHFSGLIAFSGGMDGFLAKNLLMNQEENALKLVTEFQNIFKDDFFIEINRHNNSKEIKKMIANNVIEAVPLAYMRGRTFSNSFIILDEAKNTTQKQMSMFLTRFGRNIKCCVTGDLLQSDLPTRENGLNWASSKLSPSDLVAFLTFTSDHVVRSPLVKEIMRYLYAEETSYPIKKTFRAGSLESIAPIEVVNS